MKKKTLKDYERYNSNIFLETYNFDINTDENEYADVSCELLDIMVDFNKTDKDLFIYIISNITRDYVIFSAIEFNNSRGNSHKSVQATYKALANLIHKRIVAKSNIVNKFWVNPKYIKN